MSAQRVRAARPTREWVWRAGLSLGAVLLGYCSLAQTLAINIAKSAPERAYQLAPGDGRVAGELAGRLLAGQGSTDQRARAAQIATQALAHEPLNPQAITVLAMSAQLRNQGDQARRLFLHSNALSRRDLGTRLWLIEDAVARENIPEALHNYDIALRTSRAAPELLFPVLSGAIADSTVAESLVKVLSTHPAWSEAFFNYLPNSSTPPDLSASFLTRIAKRGISVSDYAQTSVISALITAGKAKEAWDYYAALRTEARRDHSRDPRFSAQLSSPTAFDWIATSGLNGISASVHNSPQGGIFDFAAPPTVGGVVLQQSQFLPAGNYFLKGQSENIEFPDGARPFVQLMCGEQREIGRVEIPNSSEDRGRFYGELRVGADCPSQTLRLVVRPSSGIGGASGQIKFLKLAPLKRN